MTRWSSLMSFCHKGGDENAAIPKLAEDCYQLLSTQFDLCSKMAHTYSTHQHDQIL